LFSTYPQASRISARTPSDGPAYPLASLTSSTTTRRPPVTCHGRRLTARPCPPRLRDCSHSHVQVASVRPVRRRPTALRDTHESHCASTMLVDLPHCYKFPLLVNVCTMSFTQAPKCSNRTSHELPVPGFVQRTTSHGSAPVPIVMHIDRMLIGVQARQGHRHPLSAHLVPDQRPRHRICHLHEQADRHRWEPSVSPPSVNDRWIKH
jgi:hypothetical protein